MSNLTRRERESRAYKLTLASGGFSVASIATFVLGVVGVTSMGLFVLSVIATAISVVLLRRTMGT